MHRILFIETGSGFGGSAKYLSELLRLIDKNLYQPFLIYANEGPSIEKIKGSGVVSRHIPLPFYSLDFPIIKYFVLLFWYIFIALPKSYEISKFIKKNNIDLVYCNNEILTHIPSILAAKREYKKIICHNHGLRCFTFLEKRFIPFINRMICVSQATFNVIKPFLKKQALEIVYNGLEIKDYVLNKIVLDPEIRKLKEGANLVGIYGRITSGKGHLNFIKAAAEVLKERKDVLFFIIGDDLTPGKSFLISLKKYINEFKIEDHFIFIGWRGEIKSIVYGLDVVVHPCIQPEPFGLVIIEAMALEKPIIASRLGAIPEIIDDGLNGCLIDPFDIDELATKILLLLSDKNLRNEIGKKGRLKVCKKFDIETNIRRIEQIIYEEITDKA